MLLGVEGQSSPVVGDDTQPMRMEVKVSDVESSDWDNILGDKESDVQRRENMVGLRGVIFSVGLCCGQVEEERAMRCQLTLRCSRAQTNPAFPLLLPFNEQTR